MCPCSLSISLRLDHNHPPSLSTPLPRSLEAATGALQWTYETQNQVKGAPSFAAGVVFAGSGDGSINALSAANGTLLWQAFTQAPVVATPAVFRDVVIAASTDNNVYAFSTGNGSLL